MEDEGTDSTDLQTDSQPTVSRRSGRAKRTRGYNADQKVEENTNSNKLGVFEVPGRGYGLFSKESFSIKDRVICVYHRNKITRKKAYVKTQQSNYIVEITDHYKLPLCIDGWDATKNKCYNEGGGGMQTTRSTGTAHEASGTQSSS